MGLILYGLQGLILYSLMRLILYSLLGANIILFTAVIICQNNEGYCGNYRSEEIYFDYLQIVCGVTMKRVREQQ